MSRGIPGEAGSGVCRFSSLLRGRALRTSWSQKMAARSQRRALKERQRELQEARRREQEAKRQRREANIKRRQENERRAEVVEVVKNPLKLKKLKKRQRRSIGTRDTLVVGKEYRVRDVPRRRGTVGEAGRGDSK